MDHQPIKSSNLASTAYDPATQVLEVAFSSGAIYSYAGVPPEIVAELRTTESAGRYFAAHIKGNADYPATRVTP